MRLRFEPGSPIDLAYRIRKIEIAGIELAKAFT
jgi:hypothetical protein